MFADFLKYECGHALHNLIITLARHSKTKRILSLHHQACFSACPSWILLFAILYSCAGTSDHSKSWCSRAPNAPNASLPWALHANDVAKLSQQWGCNSSDNFARQLLPSVLAKHKQCPPLELTNDTRTPTGCYIPISGSRC